MEQSATEAYAPLIARLDRLITELPLGEREAVARFLEDVADAVERHADRLIRDAAARKQRALAVPLPTLWA
jgi:hypothetical protein